MGESRPGRKIVVTGDTAPCEMTRVAAHQAQLLVHDASFADEEAARAAETGHSTARQAAELAAEAGVEHARPRPHLVALRRPRGARRGARGVRRARSRRATSTWSRSRCPSAATPRLIESGARRPPREPRRERASADS